MREIKFRVYDNDLKVMYTPEMDEEHGNLWSLGRAQGGVITYPNGVLTQFTGLKDKNGKPIYEGDILINKKFDAGKGFNEPYGVYWHHNLCQFVNLYNCNESEVIGNIYESPELLK